MTKLPIKTITMYGALGTVFHLASEMQPRKPFPPMHIRHDTWHFDYDYFCDLADMLETHDGPALAGSLDNASDPG